MLLAGLSLLLYPTVSDYWNSFHQSRAIATYVEQIAQIIMRFFRFGEQFCGFFQHRNCLQTEWRTIPYRQSKCLFVIAVVAAELSQIKFHCGIIHP